MHGALKLPRLVEVSHELFFESSPDGYSVRQNHMWRCRGIWPVGILPHPWSFAERAIDPGRDSLSICLIVNPGWSRPVLIRVCRLLNHCVGLARCSFRNIDSLLLAASDSFCVNQKRSSIRVLSVQFALNYLFLSESFGNRTEEFGCCRANLRISRRIYSNGRIVVRWGVLRASLYRPG